MISAHFSTGIRASKSTPCTVFWLSYHYQEELKKLCEGAVPGDSIVFYYSGGLPSAIKGGPNNASFSYLSSSQVLNNLAFRGCTAESRLHCKLIAVSNGNGVSCNICLAMWNPSHKVWSLALLTASDCLTGHGTQGHYHLPEKHEAGSLDEAILPSDLDLNLIYAQDLRNIVHTYLQTGTKLTMISGRLCLALKTDIKYICQRIKVTTLNPVATQILVGVFAEILRVLLWLGL